MTDRELMQQALEALENQKRFWVWTAYRYEPLEMQDAITALRDRLAQPAQEPVAWAGVDFDIKTTPPSRQWVGLTDEERNNLWREVVGWGDPSHDDEDLMKAIEAKLREKNA